MVALFVFPLPLFSLPRTPIAPPPLPILLRFIALPLSHSLSLCPSLALPMMQRWHDRQSILHHHKCKKGKLRTGRRRGTKERRETWRAGGQGGGMMKVRTADERRTGKREEGGRRMTKRGGWWERNKQRKCEEGKKRDDASRRAERDQRSSARRFPPSLFSQTSQSLPASLSPLFLSGSHSLQLPPPPLAPLLPTSIPRFSSSPHFCFAA